MTEYSDFLKHLGIDKKQMLASMMSKIPESEKPSERGREMTKEDLEKENTRLKEKWLRATDEGTSWAHLKSLERENAELKKQQFSLRNERNTFLAQNEQYEKDLIDFNENLTKAKELIKKMLYEYQRLCLIKKETLAEAEQFIK